MKVAIFGLGAAAREIHIPALKKNADINIVAGFDVNPNVEGFDFPTFTSAEILLEKTSPDIVVVATPTSYHFENTFLALSAGCHVLVEKPFMTNLEEAKKIIALSKQKQKWVVVNNQYRFMNIHQAAKQQIGTDAFGQLLFISANQTFFLSDKTEAGWRGQDIQRTCKEFGIHVLDLCRFYFDEDPISIYARMPKGDKPLGPDYLNLIQLEFSGDRVAHITLDRLSKGPHRYLDMRLDGTNSIVETSLGGKAAINLGIKGGSKKPFIDLDFALGGNARIYQGDKFKKLATDPLDLFANATYELMKAFIAAIKNGTRPPCSAEDNSKTLALMLAAYESSEKNMPIKMVEYYQSNEID